MIRIPSVLNKKLMIIPSIVLLGTMYKSLIVEGEVASANTRNNLSGRNITLTEIYNNPILSSIYGIQAFADELKPVWFDVSLAGLVSMNNNSQMDYKTSPELLNSMKSYYSNVSQHLEIIEENKETPLTEDSTLNYLKEKGIISSDLSINFDGISVSHKLSNYYNYNNSSYVNKSYFLASLGKTVYGVKESRPIIIRGKSVRNGSVISSASSNSYSPYNFNYNDFITSKLEKDEIAKFNYYFNYGDINYYVTPNVSEMYYKDLVKDGVVKLSEFSDSDFVDYYKNIGKSTANWQSDLGNVDALNTNSYNVLGNGFNFITSGSEIVIEPNGHEYFNEENLKVIDALCYIEKSLRFTEKNLTNLEADIVTYKYGVSYINRIPEEYRDTVKFLVAKGIINFENEEEFDNLFKPMNFKEMCTYLYRVHNEDARFDFSKIQLTDSDNYWLSKGFGETKIELFEGSSPYFDTTIVDEVAVNYPSMVSFKSSDLGNNLVTADYLGDTSKDYKVTEIDSISNAIDAVNKDYTVKRVFDLSSYTFIYKGVELASDTKAEGDITSVSHDSSTNRLTVEFKVRAASSASAVAILDVNTTTKSKKNDVLSVGTVNAIAYVNQTSNGKNKEEKIFVSQTSLRNLPSLPLLIVNDKYIVNKQTGAKALLLNDNKKALIGNHIITYKDTMVTSLGGEIYYNLDVIRTLLSEAMLSSLDPSQFYIASGNSAEKLVDITTKQGSAVDSVYVKELNTITIGTNPTSPTPNKSKQWYINISQSSALSNYVIYDLKSDLGLEESLEMVIEFNYVLPNKEDVGVDKDFISKFNSGGLTISDVYDFAYTKPSNSTLLKWWDSNLTFSNALMNHIMGTTDVNYINSGYLMPKITILGDLTSKNSNGETYLEKLNQLFENGIGLSKDFTNTVLGYTNKSLNFINSYFNFQSSFYVSSGDATLDGLMYKRTLNYYKGIHDDNDHFTDYSEFVTIDSNKNVYINSTAVRYIESYNGSSSIVLLNSPSVLYQGAGGLQQGVIYKNSGLLGNGVYEFYNVMNKDGFSYLALMEPYKMYSDGEKLYKEKSYENDYATTITSLSKDFFGESYDRKSALLKSNDSLLPPGVTLEKGKYYYIGGKYYKIKKDGELPSDDIEVGDTKGKEVYAFPVFPLSNADYEANYSTMELSRLNNDPRLNIRNVSNVGIVTNLIDSIVYSNSTYYNISNIPNGAKVVIGSNVYEKKDGVLQSEVVSGEDVISLSGSKIEGAQFNSNFKSIAESHIGNIPMVSSAYGGYVRQFKDYVTGFSFGTGQENSKLQNVLRLGGNGNLVVTHGLLTNNYKEGTSFTGMCYSMRISKDVKFRQVGDSNRYVLVTIAVDSKDANISDTQYFTESLDFEDTLDSTMGLVPSKFKESANLGSFVEDLLEAYDAQRIEDFKGLVAYILRMIAMLMTASNLVVTVIRNPAIDSIVYDIKYRKPKGLNSYSSKKDFQIDLYSIFTLGLQNVDTEKSLLRGIVVSGCLAGVTVFLTMMYFKGF